MPFLFSKRRLSPIKYFNHWAPVRTIYHRKRSKAYRQYMKSYDPYDSIKSKPFRGGGRGEFDYKRLASKIILPHFEKTFVQLRNLFSVVRSKKSKKSERLFAFIKLLNQPIHSFIYNVNLAPTVFWARKAVENGWIYASNLHTSHNTKALFNSLSLDKLFPYYHLNTNYLSISKKANQFLQTPVKMSERKVEAHAVYIINPNFQLIIKNFFSRYYK